MMKKTAISRTEQILLNLRHQLDLYERNVMGMEPYDFPSSSDEDQENEFIVDVLYSLGVSISKENYSTEGGFLRFLNNRLDHVIGVVNIRREPDDELS